jgi:hypothetical protein
MKRDKMRIFAWSLVGLGIIIGVFTIPVARAECSRHLEIWKRWVAATGRMQPMPDCPNFAGGFLLGAGLMGFGILLLAIRRPLPRSEVQDTRRVSNPVSSGVAAAKNAMDDLQKPLPKGTVATPPPWDDPGRGRGSTPVESQPSNQTDAPDLPKATHVGLPAVG